MFEIFYFLKSGAFLTVFKSLEIILKSKHGSNTCSVFLEFTIRVYEETGY